MFQSWQMQMKCWCNFAYANIDCDFIAMEILDTGASYAFYHPRDVWSFLWLLPASDTIHDPHSDRITKGDIYLNLKDMHVTMVC